MVRLIVATVSTTTWDKRVSKIPSMLNLLNSRVKVFHASVSFVAGADSSTASPDVLDASGQLEVNLKGDGKIKEYVAVMTTYCSAGLVIQFEKSSGKITVYGDAGGTAGKMTAIDESSLSDHTLNVLGGETVEFLVMGV